MNKSTPKDVFSYFLMIVTLYIGVVSFIALLFQYANVLFPDPLDFYYQSITDVVRRGAASLFVAWPVFLLMSWLIRKDEKKDAGKREMKIRKWLLYLTLFIAAVTIIVDLITLIYNFLGGELTARFVIKIISILLVAGAVFGYYLWDIRQELVNETKLPRYFAWGTSVIIAAAIVGTFFVIGTPNKQRAYRFDEQRVTDLANLEQQIIQYWSRKDELPQSLDDLTAFINFIPPRDPQTDRPYEYEQKQALTFALCAEFQTSSTELPRGIRPGALQKLYPGVPDGNTWDHISGRICFDRTIDPEIYRQPGDIAKPVNVP